MISKLIEYVVTSYLRIFLFTQLRTNVSFSGRIDHGLAGTFHLTLLLDDESLVNTYAVHASLKIDLFFLSEPRDFELSFFYDVDMIGIIALPVNHLVTSEFLDVERPHHFFNLAFGPVIQKG